MIEEISSQLLRSQDLIKLGMEFLGVVGVLSGVFIGLRDLKSNSKKNDFEFIRKLDHYFKVEMKVARSEFSRLYSLNMFQHPNYKLQAEVICDFFEDVGHLYKSHAISDDILWCYFGDHIVLYWKLLDKFIIKYKEDRNNDLTYYKEFEYLAKKIKKLQYKNAKNKNEDDVELINKLMKEELSFNTRLFKPSDIKEVMLIEVASFEVNVDAEAQKDILGYYYSHPEGFFVTTNADNLIIGYAIIFPCIDAIIGGFNIPTNTFEIISLAVHPYYRKLGVAKDLIDILISEAKAKKCEGILLEVRDTNQSLIDWYSRLGFSSVGQSVDYYCEGVGSIIMQLPVIIRE